MIKISSWKLITQSVKVLRRLKIHCCTHKSPTPWSYSVICYFSAQSPTYHTQTHTQYTLMTCCAYSCTQYGLHTQYLRLTGADDLLCLQQNHYDPFLFILPRFSFGSPLSLPANTAKHPTTLPIFCYVTAWQIMVLHTILTSPDVTVQWQHYSDNIQTIRFKWHTHARAHARARAHTHTHTHTHTAISEHQSPSLPHFNNAWW
jgi:hypothetical protein